jgi:hypothetical protein
MKLITHQWNMDWRGNLFRNQSHSGWIQKAITIKNQFSVE